MSKLDLNLPLEKNLELIEASIAADAFNAAVYEQAILDFSTLAAKEPFSALPYRHRGHRYLSTSHDEQAAADLILSTRLDPTYWKNWDLLGMAYYYMGDFEQAIGFYDQGLLITGLHAKFTAPLVYWKYLALCRLGKKDSDEARQVLTLADLEIADAHPIYKNLVLLMRDLLTIDEVWALINGEQRPLLLATLGYGIAMKHYYNGEKDKTKKVLEDLLAESTAWYSWGHRACEVDKARLF